MGFGDRRALEEDGLGLRRPVETRERVPQEAIRGAPVARQREVFTPRRDDTLPLLLLEEVR